MALLAPLAALLGIEVETLIARLKRNAMTLALLALFGIIALVFLLVAAHLALAELVGPLLSALIIAGIALLALAIVLVSSRSAEQRRRRVVAEKRRSTDTAALVTTAAITALPMLIKNPLLRTAAVPAAAVLAYMFIGKKRAEAEKTAP